MSFANLGGLVVLVVVLIVIILGILAIVKAFYVKVPQGTALIVNGLKKTVVSFSGALVWPVVDKKEFMRISLLTLEIDRRGKEGLICKDNLRADITVAFYLKVNNVPEDVLQVARSIGVDRASNHSAVNELFNAKFSEALKTVGKQFDLYMLFENRLNFREQIVEVIGDDLNGYKLEDVAIDYLEQTPKESLDANNIFDSEGIRKITEKTATQMVVTNEIERNSELAIQKKNVETKEAKLALERQQAEAEARQRREIETTQAREQAESLKVQQEELLKSEQARIQTSQEIEVREENRAREVEVAQQNRSRAVQVEVERVKRAQQLEVEAREKEVLLVRIEKEKALEEEKKNIAYVVRERVAVDKTVAQEEEHIKDVRVLSEAERLKQSSIIDAQAEAECKMVEMIKKAEAEEKSSLHKAAEIATMAQAELDAAARQADAKKRMAEGVEAEEAALGLAEARVRQAKAQATEKEGMVEAAVTAEKMLATAKGEEEQGLARARVLEAETQAAEKQGLAEARIMEEKLTAQARGEEELGLVKAKIGKEIGFSEAEVIRRKLESEAEGLVKRFSAINELSDAARNHEEFRIQLEKQLEAVLASMEINREIAKEQADVFGAALAKTKIDIVGGDGDFFKTFTKSLTVGKAIDGFLEKSETAQALVNTVWQRTGLGSAADKPVADKPAADKPAAMPISEDQPAAVNKKS